MKRGIGNLLPGVNRRFLLVEAENVNCSENDRIHLFWIDMWGSYLMQVAVPNALLLRSLVIEVGDKLIVEA